MRTTTDDELGLGMVLIIADRGEQAVAEVIDVIDRADALAAASAGTRWLSRRIVGTRVRL